MLFCTYWNDRANSLGKERLPRWFHFGAEPMLQDPLQTIKNDESGPVARALLGLEFPGAAPFTTLVKRAGFDWLE